MAQAGTLGFSAKSSWWRSFQDAKANGLQLLALAFGASTLTLIAELALNAQCTVSSGSSAIDTPANPERSAALSSSSKSLLNFPASLVIQYAVLRRA